jgi:hypothetical protein
MKMTLSNLLVLNGVICMPRAICLALAVLALFLRSTPAKADLPDPGANAALKYWQAFATLPRFTAAEQDKLMAERVSLPLDAQLRHMLEGAKYSLDMMRRGAVLPRCEWAIGWADEGLGNLLPYLDGASQLSALACLRARIQFEEGQSLEAANDVLAAMTMSRHITVDGSLPSFVTSHAIERRLSELLARYLPRLDAATLKHLKKRLAALPAVGSLADAVRQEQFLETGWFVRKIKEAKDEASALAFLRSVWGSPDESRALIADCGGTAARVVKYTEELRSWYPTLAKQMDLPLDQFEKQQEAAALKLAANPMYKRFVPAIVRCRWLEAQAQVRRSLLLAALAVQLDGRAALKNHTDPVVGGSFDYVGFEGGFELSSKWRLGENPRSKWYVPSEPLVLLVGRGRTSDR